MFKFFFGKRETPKPVGYFHDADKFWSTLHEVANANPFNSVRDDPNPHVWSEDVLITLLRRSGVVEGILSAHGITEGDIRIMVRLRFNLPKE